MGPLANATPKEDASLTPMGDALLDQSDFREKDQDDIGQDCECNNDDDDDMYYDGGIGLGWGGVGPTR